MKHLIFDTETTGLIKNSVVKIEKQPKVIEFFGAIWDDETGEIEEHGFLINPGCKIPPEIVKITSITDEMVKESPTFFEVSEKIKALIESVDFVVAHNLAFDKVALTFEFVRGGFAVKWPRGICTIEATEHINGYRLKLSALYEHLFGESFDGAHRADADVRALVKCYQRLHEDGTI